MLDLPSFRLSSKRLSIQLLQLAVCPLTPSALSASSKLRRSHRCNKSIQSSSTLSIEFRIRCRTLPTLSVIIPQITLEWTADLNQFYSIFLKKIICARSFSLQEKTEAKRLSGFRSRKVERLIRNKHWHFKLWLVPRTKN